MAREKFELQLVESYLVTPHVKHLVFRRSDNQPVPFIPGQFMNFHFPYNDEVCQRSYSIATRDQNSGLIEVAISEVKDGAGTQFFFTMQPGDTILADGPYGKLVLQDDPKTKRYVFIATNTGITPYRSMLNLLSTRLKNSSLKMVILLGVRTPEDLLYGQELATFAEQHENVEFFACYTRKQPEKHKAFEHEGRIHAILPSLHLNPAEDIVYLCGNPNMVDEVFNDLKKLGFENSAVRREKYVFSH